MSINQHQAAVISLEERLLARLEVSESECWEWSGARTMHGYGRMSWHGRVHHVHRLAAHLWLSFDLNDDLSVCHRCDNPPCFNPDHLFVGTHSDNMQDMVAKGRASAGQEPHSFCAVGHPLTGDNVKVDTTGRRRCRTCIRTYRKSDGYRAYQREWRRKQRSVRALDAALDGAE